MYYCSSGGTRVLEGAEAALFRAGLGAMRGWLFDDVYLGEDWIFDVPVFDRLQTGQKLALLVEVGEALLLETAAEIELTAVVEGTVAAVFEAIGHEVAYERCAILARTAAEGDREF